MYRTILYSAVFCLITTGCSSKSAEQLYAAGVHEIQKGNHGGAIVFLKSALEKDQGNLNARLHLAKAYAASGKPEQAEKEFQKVLRQDPSRQEIKLELAKIHCQLRKNDLAIEEVTEYLKGHPESPEALEILAAAYLAGSRFAEAEDCLQRVLKAEPSRISAKLELAVIYGTQGKKQSAREILNGVIGKDPKNARACYMLASLEAADGNIDKALEIYRKLAELNPSDPKAPYMSGALFLKKGETEKAAKISEDIVARFPKSAEGYRLKGLIAYQRKNFTEAIAELQRSNKIRPDIEGYFFLGLSLYNNGQLENALSQFRTIIDHSPDSKRARLMAGMILLNQQRLDDSIDEIKKVLKIDADNALAHNVLGSAYLAKGMQEEGMKELNRATELDPKMIEAYLKKGVFHLTKGNINEAETDLRTAVRVRPELLNTRLVLFSHYMSRKDKNKALGVLRDGLTGQKSDAILYNHMAGVMLTDNRKADAMKYLQKAKEADPSLLLPYFNMGSIHTVARNYDKAFSEYGAVLQKDPKNLKAMLAIAALREQEGKDAEALNWYNRAKEEKNPAAFIALAGYHSRKKNTAGTLSVLDEAITAVPRNAAVLELKGRICMAEKRYQEAIKAFEELEAVNPEQGIALKARAYVTMNDIPKAVEQARRLMDKKPDSPQGYILLASIYESRKDLGRAIEELRNGLNKGKENPQALLMLGNLYAGNKDFKLASSTFAEAVRKYPDLAPAHYFQGSLLEITGKKGEAAGKYRQALARSRNYVPALNNLALLCVEGYGTKAEGLKTAEAAFNLEPGNPSVMDTFGYVLLKNGRKEEARKLLEKAAAALPDNPSVNYHLALSYRESGEKGQAAARLRRALQLGNFPEEQQARKLLAALN